MGAMHWPLDGGAKPCRSFQNLVYHPSQGGRQDDDFREPAGIFMSPWSGP